MTWVTCFGGGAAATSGTRPDGPANACTLFIVPVNQHVSATRPPVPGIPLPPRPPLPDIPPGDPPPQPAAPPAAVRQPITREEARRRDLDMEPPHTSSEGPPEN